MPTRCVRLLLPPQTLLISLAAVLIPPSVVLVLVRYTYTVDFDFESSSTRLSDNPDSAINQLVD